MESKSVLLRLRFWVVFPFCVFFKQRSLLMVAPLKINDWNIINPGSKTTVQDDQRSLGNHGIFTGFSYNPESLRAGFFFPARMSQEVRIKGY